MDNSVLAHLRSSIVIVIPLNFHSQRIPLNHSYYARIAPKCLIWNRMPNFKRWSCFYRPFCTLTALCLVNTVIDKITQLISNMMLYVYFIFLRNFFLHSMIKLHMITLNPSKNIKLVKYVEPCKWLGEDYVFWEYMGDCATYIQPFCVHVTL